VTYTRLYRFRDLAPTSTRLRMASLDEELDAIQSAFGGGGGFGFSVETYGAALDGSTDDHEALQAAIDAAHAEGGGIVTIPGGKTLLLEDQVRLKSNVVVYGLHRSATIKLGIAFPVNKLALYAEGTRGTKDQIDFTDIGFENLTFDGNRTARSDADENGAFIQIEKCLRPFMRHCTAKDSSRRVWADFGCSDGLVYHCWFQNNCKQGNAVEDSVISAAVLDELDGTYTRAGRVAGRWYRDRWRRRDVERHDPQRGYQELRARRHRPVRYGRCCD